MREIIFRGKRQSDGKWFDGNLFIPDNADTPTQICIGTKTVRIAYDIIPETVGQFTGLTDKNGKKIFEGDICRMRCDGLSGYGEIQFRHGCIGIADKKRKRFYYLDDNSELTVIGNIHDNPELLKGE